MPADKEPVNARVIACGKNPSGEPVAFATDADGNLLASTAASTKTAGAAIGTTGTAIMGSDGTNARFVLVTAAGLLRTELAGGLASVVASGNSAHDSAISGSPLRIGARALTANYTGVATGDTADLVSTVVGALVTKPYSIPEQDWSYAAAASGIVNTTTAVTIKAAAAAGIRNYITGLQIVSEALGTATEVAIRDGAGGAVLWRMFIGTGGFVNGMPIQFATPLRGTAATLLEVVTLTASGTGAVYVNAQGYTAP